NRPASAVDLLAALDALAAGQPVAPAEIPSQKAADTANSASQVATPVALPAASPPAQRGDRSWLILAGVLVLAVGFLFGGFVLWRLAAPSEQRALLSADALTIVQFRGGNGATSRIGTIGLTSYAAQYPEDSVRITVRLNDPAYCYLIAFNPNGKEQLCYPA